MSYGKYSSKDIDFTKLANNDPWFALGHMLGATYANNYNERGDKKVLQAIGDELKFGGDNPTGSSDSRMDTLNGIANRYIDENGNAIIPNQDAAPTIYASGNSQQQQPTISYAGASGIAPTGQQYAPIGNGQNIVNYTGAPQSEFDQRQYKDSIAQLAQQQPQAQAVPQYAAGQNVVNLNGGNNNLHHPIQQQANSASGQIVNFDKDVYIAQKRADLMKQGYSGDRLDNIMAQVSAMATAYDNKVKDNNSSIVIQNLLQKDQNGNYQMDVTSPEFQAKIVELAKYNPSAANMWAKNIVNGNQQWINNQGIAREGRQFGYQQAAADAQLARGKKLSKYNSDLSTQRMYASANLKQQQEQQQIAQRAAILKQLYPDASDTDIMRYIYGGGGNGSRQGNAGNGQNGVSSTMLTAANQALEREQKWLADFQNQGKEYPYAAEAAAARQVINRALTGQSNNNGQSLGGNGGGGGNYGEANARKIDYYTLNQQIQRYKAAHNGQFDESGKQQLRAYYGIDPNNTDPEDTINKYINSIG